MEESLTHERKFWKRFWIFIAGAGMIIFSALTIRHFFYANFPDTIFAGSICDISSFFNCSSSAYSPIAHFRGIPMGYFGLFMGGLIALCALFPSAGFVRTNKFLSLLNAIGVIVLLIYSVFFLGSLCLLCSGYYLFSFICFALFWKFDIVPASGSEKTAISFLSPSIKYLVVFAVILGVGAYGFHHFYIAKKQAQIGGAAIRIVKDYYSLNKAKYPSIISPYWVAKATDRFEDAPIQVIEYADFRCPDCLFLYQQFKMLKNEYKGKINIAFYFFPLEAVCNHAVSKNKHPGACDLSYMAAYDPAKFIQIHDEIFENFEKGKDPAWRAQLAKKYSVEAALTDQKTKDLVGQLINTATEYEKNDEKHPYGIRATPTMIINNRMVIGTMPYPYLKAIFESLLAQQSGPGEKRFMESWVD